MNNEITWGDEGGGEVVIEPFSKVEIEFFTPTHCPKGTIVHSDGFPGKKFKVTGVRPARIFSFEDMRWIDGWNCTANAS